MNSRNEAHADPGAAFRRLQDAMRKLVKVPKRDVDEKIAAERRAKRPRSKPA
jgi:hypothetical protein